MFENDKHGKEKFISISLLSTTKQKKCFSGSCSLFLFLQLNSFFFTISFSASVLFVYTKHYSDTNYDDMCGIVKI